MRKRTQLKNTLSWQIKNTISWTIRNIIEACKQRTTVICHLVVKKLTIGTNLKKALHETLVSSAAKFKINPNISA